MREHVQRILGAGADHRLMLGVGRRATAGEAARAYIKISARIHGNNAHVTAATTSERADAEEAFKRLGEAKMLIAEPDSTPAKEWRQQERERREDEAWEREQERQRRQEEAARERWREEERERRQRQQSGWALCRRAHGVVRRHRHL